MLKEISKEIEYKDKKYKVVFNLNVMERIQEEYKTLDKWGELTDGSSGEVDIKALVFGFTEMINEGIEIDNEDQDKNEPLLSHKKVARILSEVGFANATKQMNDLVVESTKEDEGKNE